MNPIAPFLICEDPPGFRWFILHTQSPRCLIEVTDFFRANHPLETEHITWIDPKPDDLEGTVLG